MVGLIQEAIAASGKKIPFHQVTIGIKGEIKAEREEKLA
jgi:hypothetical protein